MKIHIYQRFKLMSFFLWCFFKNKLMSIIKWNYFINLQYVQQQFYCRFDILLSFFVLNTFHCTLRARVFHVIWLSFFLHAQSSPPMRLLFFILLLLMLPLSLLLYSLLWFNLFLLLLLLLCGQMQKSHNS